MKTLMVLLLVMIAALAGCATKSNADARARQAFAAGQQQTFAQINEARRTSILFIGPVRQREVPWSDGLTLAQAVAAAGYTDARDPRNIFVNRQRIRIPFDPQALLRGKDLLLEPGDTIEIYP